MSGVWALVASLPALFVRLLDLLKSIADRRDRAELRTEAATVASAEVEAAAVEQERVAHDAMADAVGAVPDRDAAARRLRDGEF